MTTSHSSIRRSDENIIDMAVWNYFQTAFCVLTSSNDIEYDGLAGFATGKKISGVDLQSAGMDVYYDYNAKDYKF